MDLQCTNPNYIRIYNKFVFQTKNKFELIDRNTFLQPNNNPYIETYQVRCNKCLACRIYKGYVWSNRLQAEAKQWKYVYFLTLTFSDFYLHEVDLKKPNRQFQLFMKRLRKKFKGLSFKHYAVSELGGETLRFHYHCILYSMEHIFLDMFLQKKTRTANYYVSNTLTNIWQYGNSLIAYAEPNSMRYVANYVNKDGALSHCFSKGLGTDYIVNDDQNLTGTYVINGKFSPVPRAIKRMLEYPQLTMRAQNKMRVQELKLGTIRYLQNEMRENILNKQLYRKKT